MQKAPEPKPVAAKIVAAAPAAKEPVSEAEFWPQLTAIVQERRPLAVSWLKAGTLLGIARNVIKVGFPPTEGFARDSLLRPAQVSFLEALAQELLGRSMKFEFVLDASLKPPAFSEIGLGLLDDPPPAAKPAIRRESF